MRWYHMYMYAIYVQRRTSLIEFSLARQLSSHKRMQWRIQDLSKGGGSGPLKEEPIKLRSRMKPKRGPRGRRSRVLKLLKLLLGVNLAIYMYIYMIINIGHQKEGGGGALNPPMG